MNTLTTLYRHQIIINKAVSKLIAVFTIILLLSLGAYIRIPLPFTPVPITLQTFFVLLGGAMLGRKYAPIATCGYLFLGGLGLPIFQGYGGGILHILGPTGGYLIGFIAASFVIGSLIDFKRNNPSFGWTVFSMALGQVLIYAFGIWWLAVSLKLSLVKAIYLGFIPFLPGAAFKLITASLIYTKFSSTR